MTDDWDGLYWQAMLRQAQWEAMMRPSFWGRRCEYCERGTPAEVWVQYDGSGRHRQHIIEYDDRDPVTAPCAAQSWFWRHPVQTALWTLALVAVLLVAVLGPAHAVYGTPQERAACLPDRKRFCPYLTDDSSLALIWFCIKTNRSRFSPACSAVLRNNGY